MPTEDWHPPTEVKSTDYRVRTQYPGEGYRHVVTPREIRERLAALPSWMLFDLDVVQLSRMTRKKQTFPCYGMQWGSALYLYPIESNLVEEFTRPPKPSVVIESQQFGATWLQEGNMWYLRWTRKSIKDFYLNNILIHELGHLLDHRNASYVDRERFAEWFAMEYGYRRSQRRQRSRRNERTIRRHHKC